MQPRCPICQSNQITVMANGSSPLDLLLSPESLSALGASICKSQKINPAIGAVAGTAIGSVINLSKARFSPLKTISYQCNNCHHTFNQPF